MAICSAERGVSCALCPSLASIWSARPSTPSARNISVDSARPAESIQLATCVTDHCPRAICPSSASTRGLMASMASMSPMSWAISKGDGAAPPSSSHAGRDGSGWEERTTVARGASSGELRLQRRTRVASLRGSLSTSPVARSTSEGPAATPRSASCAPVTPAARNDGARCPDPVTTAQLIASAVVHDSTGMERRRAMRCGRRRSTTPPHLSRSAASATVPFLPTSAWMATWYASPWRVVTSEAQEVTCCTTGRSSWPRAHSRTCAAARILACAGPLPEAGGHPTRPAMALPETRAVPKGAMRSGAPAACSQQAMSVSSHWEGGVERRRASMRGCSNSATGAHSA
mmetsp:Transcript_60221/g.191317  ORF Transcript_60221/g.191317 Transcript_60221/m.191317 type:complete len:345 (-) Transcript_60221:973-2007(-)